MLKRRSVGYLIQGIALLALFILTLFGAPHAWLLMTMLLSFAVVCFIGAAKARRVETRTNRSAEDS